MPATPAQATGLGFHEAVAAAKRAILREALAAEDGHQTKAAKRLGLTQPYLARLLKNLNLR
jgi:DNA-binding NtrC family response regulator